MCRQAVCYMSEGHGIKLWDKENMEDEGSESQCVVKAAAKLIRAEIQEHGYDTDHYPTERVIGDPEVAFVMSRV